MDRKDFIKKASLVGVGGTLAFNPLKSSKGIDSTRDSEPDREYWISTMRKIADPVLNALSERKLRKLMPVETVPGSHDDRRPFTHLEAFGRLMTGIAPWLELGDDGTAEGKVRAKYIELSRESLSAAVDPKSPDFLNFDKGRQPLVDTAFLAHALIKAPEELWEKSSATTRNNVIKALKSSRTIIPYHSNWILFSAMVEAALKKFNAGGDKVRMDLAVKQMDEWYLGDGVYGDGPPFHWDYYNSYVIQPFMLDILDVMRSYDRSYEGLYQKNRKISRRYAEELLGVIAPDGTYPPIGRSITYRFGAFQLLAQVAWEQFLPERMSPAQARTGLTKVIKKIMEAPGNFDKDGWLQLGVYGHQPHLAETYISTGSLYLCSAVFVPLGLKPDNPFWKSEASDWRTKEIWSGKDVKADYHLNV
ncbi:MAG TPA: DUF2264 domain-containing protein [Balneolales bacterium]|nr:DUF2264 domain-containing protein [Balneolales bacterium]